MKFFEDIRVGETVEIGSHVFTAEDIKTFAQRFDPQPFHVDDEAAARSHFGRLCASGWHTACVWMRLLIDRRRREDDERRARGEAVAQLGPSPGFRDLQWLKPVYVGDTVSYGSEVIETRPLNNRPGWGMISMHNTGVNQRGEQVISFISSVFVERRDAGGQTP
jgi:acyl dehydratase